jgi:predicted MFS family arabinose efflux permease
MMAEETENKENTRWYKKKIYVVTMENFISFFYFLLSVFFYFIYLTSEGEAAKSFSIFAFSFGIGEIIGEKISKKYNIKNIYWFLVLLLVISYIVGQIIVNSDSVLAALIGIAMGVSIGFESKKLKRSLSKSQKTIKFIKKLKNK